MSITNFVIRIAFLVLPGIIASKIYQQLTGKKVGKDWEDFSGILLFSLCSYLILGLGLTIYDSIFNLPISKVQSLQALVDDKYPINWVEVFIACLIAIILAYVASKLFYKFKFINKLGKILKVTNRYGDNDLWDYFHNMDASLEWVTVRDYQQGLVYYGRISVFSDTGQERELIMEDVDIYHNTTGELINTVPILYLSRDKFSLNIEVVPSSGNSHDQVKKGDELNE